MGDVSCSVVAYLPGSLGEFVNGLRARLNPRFARWLSHISILPPRPLPAHPDQVLAQMQEKCQYLDPFEAKLEEVHTFWPVKGVVYLAVSLGSERLAELHDLLNGGPLGRVEPFPYVPHITLAQELDEAETRAVLHEASQAWVRYAGPTTFRVESLSLVRQREDLSWVDLAPVALGGALKPVRR
jgi:2'-5' RNA ligase